VLHGSNFSSNSIEQGKTPPQRSPEKRSCQLNNTTGSGRSPATPSSPPSFPSLPSRPPAIPDWRAGDTPVPPETQPLNSVSKQEHPAARIRPISTRRAHAPAEVCRLARAAAACLFACIAPRTEPSGSPCCAAVTTERGACRLSLVVSPQLSSVIRGVREGNLENLKADMDQSTNLPRGGSGLP
jgi:hypothetical protein